MYLKLCSSSKDFQEGAEGIPSNVLANRLRKLVANGLLEKRLYQEHPQRYEYHLTDAGKGLLPIVQSMAVWAAGHVEGVEIPSLPA